MCTEMSGAEPPDGSQPDRSNANDYVLVHPILACIYREVRNMHMVSYILKHVTCILTLIERIWLKIPVEVHIPQGMHTFFLSANGEKLARFFITPYCDGMHHGLHFSHRLI
jgi:hypothetical protein